MFALCANLVNWSEQSVCASGANLGRPDPVYEGYLTSVNWFCSIVSKARLALPSVQLYSAVVHNPRVNRG